MVSAAFFDLEVSFTDAVFVDFLVVFLRVIFFAATFLGAAFVAFFVARALVLEELAMHLLYK